MTNTNKMLIKILTSALLFTTLNDLITGTSVDIMVPVLNRILPGDVRKPITILNMNFFLTRYCIRIINVFLAFFLVKYLTTKTNSSLVPPQFKI